MKLFYTVIAMLGLLSCSTYKIANRHLDRKMEKAEMEISTWTNLDGDVIEYWDSGDTTKPVMLLVHGFGATTKYQWYKQVKMLSKDYRLIAPNLNYFGQSQPVNPNYSVAGQVELLEKLVDFLEIDSLSVFGVSYGGLVGIEFAKRHVDKTTQLLLFDTPVKFADSSNIVAVKEYFNVASVEELFVPSDAKGLNKLMYLATGKKSHIPKGFLTDFYEKCYAYNLEDKRKLITGLLDDLTFYQTSEYAFDCPVLLIWGSEDKVVPLETGEKLQEYLGDQATLKVIQKAAHMPNLTHTKKFNKIVQEFLTPETSSE